MKRSGFFHVLLLFSWFLLVALYSSFASATTVRVGCLYPLTGPAGLYGRDSVIAIRMAQRHLRALGGYPNLEILVEDTRSKSFRSLQIARRYIEEDKVNFLCGVVSSGIALMVSRLAYESSTFFIGTDHASPKLVSSRKHPFYFRVSNDTRQSMLAGARFIKRHYQNLDKSLRIAFIGPDYDYGYQAWDDLRYFLDEEAVPFEVVGEFWPRLFETGFHAYINELKHLQPDIVINAQWGLDLVSFIKQGNQARLFEVTQFMNFDTGGNYQVLAHLGKEMPLGLVLSARHNLNWPETEENKKFVADFYEASGRYPGYAAQGAYSGIVAIAQAVKQAGGVEDQDKLRESLTNLRLKLPEDPDGFESFMDPDSHQMLQVQAIGRTVPDNRYPPAETSLGQWSVFYPPTTWPKNKKEALSQ